MRFVRVVVKSKIGLAGVEAVEVEITGFPPLSLSLTSSQAILCVYQFQNLGKYISELVNYCLGKCVVPRAGVEAVEMKSQDFPPFRYRSQAAKLSCVSTSSRT